MNNIEKRKAYLEYWDKTEASLEKWKAISNHIVCFVSLLTGLCGIAIGVIVFLK